MSTLGQSPSATLTAAFGLFRSASTLSAYYIWVPTHCPSPSRAELENGCLGEQGVTNGGVKKRDGAKRSRSEADGSLTPSDYLGPRRRTDKDPAVPFDELATEPKVRRFKKKYPRWVFPTYCTFPVQRAAATVLENGGSGASVPGLCSAGSVPVYTVNTCHLFILYCVYYTLREKATFIRAASARLFTGRKHEPLKSSKCPEWVLWHCFRVYFKFFFIPDLSRERGDHRGEKLVTL